MSNSNSSMALLLLAILSLIWGSAYWFIKHALGIFDPLELGMMRMSIAALALLPLAIKDIRRLEKKDMPYLLIVGFCGNFLPAVLFPLAQQVITSAEAGVLNSMSPLFMIAVSYLFFGKRYPLINIIGILVGLTGAVVLVLGAGDTIDFNGKVGYALFVVLATLCYAISANVAKHFFTNYPPTRLTSFAICIWGLPAILYVAFGTDAVSDITTKPGGWEAFAYVAILGAIMSGLAVILFYKMLQISSLVYASMVTYTMPIVVAFLAFLDEEPMGWPHFLGMGIILFGVFLVNRK